MDTIQNGDTTVSTDYDLTRPEKTAYSEGAQVGLLVGIDANGERVALACARTYLTGRTQHSARLAALVLAGFLMAPPGQVA